MYMYTCTHVKWILYREYARKDSVAAKPLSLLSLPRSPPEGLPTIVQNTLNLLSPYSCWVQPLTVTFAKEAGKNYQEVHVSLYTTYIVYSWLYSKWEDALACTIAKQWSIPMSVHDVHLCNERDTIVAERDTRVSLLSRGIWRGEHLACSVYCISHVLFCVHCISHFAFLFFHFVILHFAFYIVHLAFSTCILHFVFPIFYFAFCILHFAFCNWHLAFGIWHFISHFPYCIFQIRLHIFHFLNTLAPRRKLLRSSCNYGGRTSREYGTAGSRD